jgi:hypothetical protein
VLPCGTSGFRPEGQGPQIASKAGRKFWWSGVNVRVLAWTRAGVPTLAGYVVASCSVMQRDEEGGP